MVKGQLERQTLRTEGVGNGKEPRMRRHSALSWELLEEHG